ncbi:MAG: helix-turn-helix domain-containing protein [Syntrophomonadaceae bacterium]|nr:helix-turn-helix domain-containing protein [Syntrophomonadaceae bacterium]
MSEKKLWRAPHVARLLDIPEARVYALAREGRFPGVVRIGRHVRFDPAAIEEFIKSGGQALPGGWKWEA